MVCLNSGSCIPEIWFMLQSSPIFYNKYKSQIYFLQPEFCSLKFAMDPGTKMVTPHSNELLDFNRRTTGRWPFFVASCNAVAPVSNVARVSSAPAASSRATQCTWPWNAAKSKGVQPAGETFTVKKRNHIYVSSCIIIYHRVSSCIIIYHHILSTYLNRIIIIIIYQHL